MAHFAGAGEAVPTIGDGGETVDDSAFLVGGNEQRDLQAAIDSVHSLQVAVGFAEVLAGDEHAAEFIFDDKVG